MKISSFWVLIVFIFVFLLLMFAPIIGSEEVDYPLIGFGSVCLLCLYCLYSDYRMKNKTLTSEEIWFWIKIMFFAGIFYLLIHDGHHQGKIHKDVWLYDEESKANYYYGDDHQ